MAEDIEGDAFDVLRGDITAAAKEGVGLGAEGEGDGGAGGSAELDEALEIDVIVGGVAGGADEINDVILDFVIEVDGVDDVAGGEDLGDVDHGRGGGQPAGAGHEFEDLALLLAGGVIDAELEHEAIDLGFGEGIGAFLFDGVLGG